MAKPLGVFRRRYLEQPLPQHGILYFDHLSAEIRSKPSEAFGEELKSTIEDLFKKRQDRSLTWNDLYTFDLILCRLLSPERLAREVWSLRSRYRDIAGLREYEAYLASKPPDPAGQVEEKALRADIEFLYNGDAPDATRSDEQKQFEVKEEISGIERTLIIQSFGVGASIEFVEVIPVDGGGQPVDSTVRELSETRRTVTYKDDLAAAGLRIRTSGLNVGAVESVNACVWACGWEGGVRFREPQAVFIERPEAIRIDMLGSAGGESRGLEAHLLALFGIIVDKAARRNIHLDCRYHYQVREGGAEVSVPVVGQVQFAIDRYRETISSLASAINHWHKDFSPRTGTFVFGIKVYTTDELGPALVLHLSQLLLPSESITDLA